MDCPQFSCEMEVRDYECDLQGIVNNARYQHYLEHARHTFLRRQGIDFAEVTARGIFLIVTRIEIDYKHPLRAGERFRVDLRLERISRIRFAFEQTIHRLDDQRLIIRARVFTAAMNPQGRPVRFPPDLEALLAD
jgi:acyl-CoA thioester hydrolase